MATDQGHNLLSITEGSKLLFVQDPYSQGYRHQRSKSKFPRKFVNFSELHVLTSEKQYFLL